MRIANNPGQALILHKDIQSQQHQSGLEYMVIPENNAVSKV
jgi:hypothetical protein